MDLSVLSVLFVNSRRTVGLASMNLKINGFSILVLALMIFSSIATRELA